MKTRTNAGYGSPSTKRFLSINEAAWYLSLGINTTRKFVEEAGCIRRVGKRLLIDRLALDAVINERGTE